VEAFKSNSERGLPKKPWNKQSISREAHPAIHRQRNTSIISVYNVNSILIKAIRILEVTIF
jgi:hypothetical protein